MGSELPSTKEVGSEASVKELGQQKPKENQQREGFWGGESCPKKAATATATEGKAMSIWEELHT